MNKILVTKDGFNALTDTNPNHFIIDTSLNTLKVVGEGTKTESLGINAFQEQFCSKAHGLSYRPIVMAFAKFDGKVYLPGEFVNARDAGYITIFSNLSVDNTNINFKYINDTETGLTMVFKYYMFEAPLDGSGQTITDDYGIRVSKSGYSTLENPINLNNLTFTSEKNTLKYYVTGSKIVEYDWSDYYDTYESLGGTFYAHEYIESVTHNLGYYPFFDGSISATSTMYLKMPNQFGDAGYYGYEEIYVDTTKIYFRARIGNQSNSGSSSRTFYYKLFKNNLGL